MPNAKRKGEECGKPQININVVKGGNFNVTHVHCWTRVYIIPLLWMLFSVTHTRTPLHSFTDVQELNEIRVLSRIILIIVAARSPLGI